MCSLRLVTLYVVTYQPLYLRTRDEQHLLKRCLTSQMSRGSRELKLEKVLLSAAGSSRGFTRGAAEENRPPNGVFYQLLFPVAALKGRYF